MHAPWYWKTVICHLITVLLVGGSSGAAWAGPSSWTRTIHVHEAGSENQPHPLEFGVRPTATDGINVELGQVELPPPPAAGIFEARFIALDTMLGNGVHLDLRDGSQEPQAQHTLIMELRRAAGGDITISWDKDRIEAVTEAARLRDRFDGAPFFDVDMHEVGEWVITQAAIEALEIVFTSKPDVETDELVIIQQPASTTISGQPVSPMVVEVKAVYLQGLPFPENAVEETLLLPNQTISVSLASGAGTLSGTREYRTGPDGRATLDEVIYTAAADGESFTLTAAVNGMSVTSTPIVATIPVEQLLIVQQPGPTIYSGQPMNSEPMIVEVRGHGIPLANRSVAVTRGSGDGALDGTLIYQTGPDGRARLDEAFYTAAADGESFTLTAAVNGMSVTSTPVIAAIPVDQLNIVQQPGPTVYSGKPMSNAPMIVEVRGQGLPLAGRSVAVTLGSGEGTLSGTVIYQTGADGRATLDGSIYNAEDDGEAFTLTATVNGFSATSSVVYAEITVVQLIFTVQPDHSISGHPLGDQPVVVAYNTTLDQVETDFAGVVTLTVSSGQGSLSGSVTRAAENGVAAFTDVIYTAAVDNEAVTLRASGGGLAVVSEAFVSDVVATRLVFTTQPSGSLSGAPLTVPPVVRAEDDRGVLDTDFAGDVTLSVSSGQGSLSGSVTRAAENGVAAFSNVIYTAAVDKEAVTLRASGGGLVVVSEAFVADVAATRLVFTTQPGGSLSGAPLTVPPVVRAEDDRGVLDTDFTATVTLNVSSGQGSLSGSVTQAAENGVAAFSDVVYTAAVDKEAVTLQASGGGLAVVSEVFVSDVVATRLVFTTQPGGSLSGAPLTAPPVVRAEDERGVLDTDFAGDVTLSVSSGQGSLSGSVTRAAENGVAAFTDVIYTAIGDNESFTLSAASNDVSVTSEPVVSQAPANAWAMTVAAADAATVSTTLTFGLWPSATDGLDAALGEEELHLAPPAVNVSACWQLPGGQASIRDFRSNDNDTAEWLIAVQTEGGRYPITFTWDPMRVPAGSSLRLQDRHGGQFVDVDMMQQSSYALTDQSITQLAVSYGLRQTFTYALQEGWSMISLPVDPEERSLATLYPKAISAFAFDGAYQRVTALEPARGYWVNQQTADTVELSGSAIDQLHLTLPAGWSLIGAPLNGVARNAIVQDPAGIVISIWGYTAGRYHQADQLTAGQGYWVNLNAPGSLVMEGGAGVPKRMAAAAPAGSADVRKNHTLWAESGAHQQVLSLGVARDDVVALPPRPPSGVFDVRIELDQVDAWQAPYSTESREYRVHVQGESVRFSWAHPTQGESPWELVINGQALALTGSGTVRIDGTRDTVWLRSPGSALPETFDLQQNIPNPFNAHTVIAYALPAPSAVVLRIYNLLGQPVRTLVQGEQTAGVHRVVWDGRDDRGRPASSGVYVYRMTTSTQRAVRHMVLLR